MKPPTGYHSPWEVAAELVGFTLFLVLGTYLVGIASTIEFTQ